MNISSYSEQFSELIEAGLQHIPITITGGGETSPIPLHVVDVDFHINEGMEPRVRLEVIGPTRLAAFIDTVAERAVEIMKGAATAQSLFLLNHRFLLYENSFTPVSGVEFSISVERLAKLILTLEGPDQVRLKG